MNLDQHIKDVLTNTIKLLFPVNIDPATLIKSHTWRNRKYIGEINGKVVSWKGFSANLNSVDFRYRAIFVDVVENVLPIEERIRLFGEDFVSATLSMPSFVVMFVLDFPLTSTDDIKEQGFVPRIMPQVAHACAVANIPDFLSQTSLHWAAIIARLVMLQRVLSIHRKPLAANEVPLQNLLYRTGYLHGYVIKGGLELVELSRPRRAGSFGHDLHAVVRNPILNLLDPFAVGIEIYTGSMGYHSQTIPQYIGLFGLKGMIVISKDNPLPTLQNVSHAFHLPIRSVSNLTEIGDASFVAIHHLPLEKVVTDLTQVRDELEVLLPTTKFIE